MIFEVNAERIAHTQKNQIQSVFISKKLSTVIHYVLSDHIKHVNDKGRLRVEVETG